MADPDATIPPKYRKKIVVLAPASDLTRMLEKRKEAKDGSKEKAVLESKIRAYVKDKGWKPREHEHFDQGTPTSHLQGRVRKYHKWKKSWYFKGHLRWVGRFSKKKKNGRMCLVLGSCCPWGMETQITELCLICI